jgi:hypothetical protein
VEALDGSGPRRLASAMRSASRVRRGDPETTRGRHPGFGVVASVAMGSIGSRAGRLPDAADRTASPLNASPLIASPLNASPLNAS